MLELEPKKGSRSPNKYNAEQGACAVNYPKRHENLTEITIVVTNLYIVMLPHILILVQKLRKSIYH